MTRLLKSIDCTVDAYNGELFVGLYNKTKVTAKALCNEFLLFRGANNVANNVTLRLAFIEFAQEAKDSLDSKGMNESADYKKQFDNLKATFSDFTFDDIKLPEFKTQNPFGDADFKGYFEPGGGDRFVINQVQHCDSVSAGMSCVDIFKDFKNAFNPYRSVYNNIYDNRQLLSELGSRWDKFLDVSKSQTFLEVYLTTAINASHFKKDHLVGPPDYQIIALHPQLIYDSMDKAPDGSKQELGLAVEWLGINFWDWKIPLGLSAASVYVDRAGVDDVGHGVMLHVYNHYAIGWADHGGDDSVYITIDLLKLFEEKKDKYDTYLSYGG